MPQRSTSHSLPLPAPVGGLNAVDPGYAMPLTDCPVLFNLTSAENGVRSRLGWREWCTGLVGIGDNTVRTVIPFTGSDKSGANNRLFAATSKGIYDVSSSSTSPPLVVTFGTQAGDAGYGISTVFVNAGGGHFLLFWGEENGYYVYSEATTTWTKVVQAANTAWATATVYAAAATVSSGGLTYKTTTGGTSGTVPPTGTGTGFNDGGVLWDYAPSIGGVDPAKLAFGMVWKNRVWMVEKNSGNAWWLPVGAVFGTASRQALGGQFKGGGDLRGLYNRTLDGGAGIDDLLVAISGGGDVVIYGGTDPASSSTFGLVGKWSVGGVPYGRRIATADGGDVLIMSSTGIIPTSRLVTGQGGEAPDRIAYSTYKIGPLFNRLAAQYGDLRAWSLQIHPEDNSLMVAVPQADGQNTIQLAMSLATPQHGWSQYRDLPLLSMGAWGRKLYFGTADGRVCVNTGGIDGVLLSDPSAYTPIDCSGISCFSNLGMPTQKQLTIIRPTIISEGGAVPMSVAARYRYDLTEAPKPVSAAPTAGTATWNVSLWDVAKWGGSYAPQQQSYGAVGMGPDAAVAFRFLATSRTVLLGFDLSLTIGASPL